MLGATLATDAYLQRLNEEVSRIDQASMQRWADLIFQAWEKGRFVFIFGNGERWRITPGAHVGFSRPVACDIPGYQAERASQGRIGS